MRIVMRMISQLPKALIFLDCRKKTAVKSRERNMLHFFGCLSQMTYSRCTHTHIIKTLQQADMLKDESKSNY